MGSDKENKFDCCILFGDELLPSFMFFFSLNDHNYGVPHLDEDNETDKDHDNDVEHHTFSFT